MHADLVPGTCQYYRWTRTMALSQREKDAEKALRRLTPVFDKWLSPDVRVELYGRDMLTWHENERIMETARRSRKEAVEEILRALDRRGAEGLDELADILELEEEQNKKILTPFREKWPKVAPTLESTQPPPVGVFAEGRPAQPIISAEIKKEFLVEGEWPYERQVHSLPSMPIPPPPVEGVDTGKKDAYKMTSKPRGLAIIINNRKFTSMNERVGTDIDAESLTNLFVFLGFRTKRYDNLRETEFKKRLQDVADLDHSMFDCLMVAILTHGKDGKVYSTDEELIPVKEITSYFDGNNCPSLIGKPKVFILQACRGGKFDYGVEMEGTDSADAKPVPEEEVKEMMEQQFDEKTLDEKDKSALGDETDGGGYNKSALPVEADYIIAYATLPGYVSWRNSGYGSWFVKAFTDTMFESAKKEHLMDILTQVNGRVAEEFESKKGNKQMPAPVTTLRRKLFFRPGSYEKR